jgi:histidyl-tRNA synthetase
VSEGAVKKEERRKFQAIKGTRDLLPPETALWNRVEQTAHEIFSSYGYGEIRVPIFEPTELFARAVGGETDIVSKEMYTFEDRDDTSISLRPEATASICRAYIEHGMQQLPQPVKLYLMGPMFRRERPQKGRYRQFYQIDAEVLGGSDAPAIDAELIEMVMTFFHRLGLEAVQLHINSIGDKNCRPKYVELLRAELLKVKDKLGPDSQRRVETNPLRVLDSKVESEQEIIEKLPRIAQHLCDACRENYDEVKRQLALRGIIYSQNFRLVRGLDYYMRTTFEITAKGLGSQNAVCGGGRYDGLVEMLGGPPTKGIGFAIGEDRLILSLQEAGKGAVSQGRDVYIAWMGEKAYTTAIRAAKNLREAGFSVELPPVEQKFGKALGQADKLGAKFALILGDNEVASGEWTLKTLATGEQTKLAEAKLLEHLRKAKGVSS